MERTSADKIEIEPYGMYKNKSAEEIKLKPSRNINQKKYATMVPRGRDTTLNGSVRGAKSSTSVFLPNKFEMKFLNQDDSTNSVISLDNVKKNASEAALSTAGKKRLEKFEKSDKTYKLLMENFKER